MAQVLDFERNGGRSSTGLQASPGGVGLLSFCLIGEVVPDSGNGEAKAPVLGNRFDFTEARASWLPFFHPRDQRGTRHPNYPLEPS